MNIPFKKASTLSKAEGSKLGWRERLAALKGKGKQHKPTAKLEVDDATGEKLVFPEIGDISEIAEGVAVTATDGEHVFVADTTTYTVTVAGGKVTTVVETPVEAGEDPEAETEMNAETVAFVEAVAEALEVGETFQATATADIAKLTTDLATALAEIKTLKSTMSHAKAPEGEGGEPKEFKVGGKKIDLSKINLK